MNRHRKPSVGTAAALCAVGPMLYVLSFGPACWLDERAESPIVARSVTAAYRPILWSVHRFPLVEQGALWYARIGARPGRDPEFDGNGINWWTTVSGGSVTPFSITISCDFPPDADDVETGEADAENVPPEDTAAL